jgi:hypothetical protein
MIAFEATDLQKQIEKDAMMQLVTMRLNDEEGVNISGLLSVIEKELTKESNNLIVKTRAI